MKKVAITANTSWYLYNFRINTIKALLESDYKVIAIAPLDDYSSKLKSLGVEYININIDQGGTNVFKDLKTLIDFYSIYKENPVDVVLNFTPKNNIYSTLAASRFDIKVINNIAGLGLLFVSENITSKIARFLYKVSQRYADKIFFQNDDDRHLFLKSIISTPSRTERLPGSGVDLSRFTVVHAPDDNVVRFLLVARMIYDKGILQYVESAKNLKEKYGDNVEFSLLGFLDVNNPSAISSSTMNSWTEAGYVNYCGVSDNVEAEIGFSDCIVLPSFYREGVPKSLLEAGAMGKPIITTDNVGCRETVEHGVNGFICEPKSVESLTDMLERMIKMSHENRIKMGISSRTKMATEFDEQIVIKKYLNAINYLNSN